MSRPNYGPQVKKRTRQLCAALLSYANDYLPELDYLPIEVNWQTERHLVVRTQVRYLAELTAKCSSTESLTKEQVKECLQRLQDFLGILEDHRTKTRGSAAWHFSLKFWRQRWDVAENLQVLEEEWDTRHGSPSRETLEEPLSPTIKPKDPLLPRPQLESRCYQTIQQAGGLIRIKAPRKMGKTTLLTKILAFAEQQNYHQVCLNFLQAEAEKFESLDQFLRWFCAYISQKLHLPSQPRKMWDPDRGSIVNCTTYFQEYILESLVSPLVLGLDEVDRVFQFSDIAQGFFPMLRSWHEEAKMVEVWENLRLVVVHSTEDYGPLDINQSPFNVGLPLELQEFTPKESQELGKIYQLESAMIPPLKEIVGGHPYLLSLALKKLATQEVKLQQLLAEATTDAGIYAHHLRRHWLTLKENPELAMAMAKVVTDSEPVQLETFQAYKLYSMGLIKRQGDRVIPRCLLYREYLAKRLEQL